MTIYIVRHGNTDWNAEGRCAGRIDVPLNEIGINQAKQIKEELKDIHFDKVYSSPLKRAYQTAKIISDDVVVDERLIERSNGDLEGKLRTEITEMIDFNNPFEDKYNIEPVTTVRKRVKEFFDEIIKDKESNNILVVTHAGIGIYARCYFEGDPADGDYKKYKMKNCEVIKYER